MRCYYYQQKQIIKFDSQGNLIARFVKKSNFKNKKETFWSRKVDLKVKV